MDANDRPALATAPAGRALAALMTVLLRVRGPRPIHTTGTVLEGTLRWRPRSAARSGIAWIDDRPDGEVRVVARLSRGAALTASLPDVIGLAVRPEGGGDLLLASTGIGVPGRFVVRPRRSAARGLLSTVMPYRGADGPVLVGARTTGGRPLPARMDRVHAALALEPWTLELLFASPAGRWHRFADLALTAPAGAVDSRALRFDPVLRPPRGAETYAWTRALREPSYAAGRRPGTRPSLLTLLAARRARQRREA